jgi:hypothetical protein
MVSCGLGVRFCALWHITPGIKSFVRLRLPVLGNVSSPACQGALQEAWLAKSQYDDDFNYILKYRELYRHDAAALNEALAGLSQNEVQHLLAIEAIAKESGRNVTEVAAEYRAIMAAHGITSSLAGTHYGIKGNKVVNNKPVAEAGKGEIQQAEKVPEATTNKVTAGKGTTQLSNKVPNGYSEFDSSLSAASNNKGGLPEGFRRVINDTTGEIKILGSDGKIYNEIKLNNGLTSLQHLQYEPAPYHGTTNNPVKNKAPAYGQDALDMSIQIKDTSTRRIGIDYKTDEFVVFDNTIKNTYHGHVRTWNELTQEMKNTLIKNGVTDKKGKVIKR